jgi:hypothetical protein
MNIADMERTKLSWSLLKILSFAKVEIQQVPLSALVVAEQNGDFFGQTVCSICFI